jgi:hypothetical protein
MVLSHSFRCANRLIYSRRATDGVVGRFSILDRDNNVS